MCFFCGVWWCVYSVGCTIIYSYECIFTYITTYIHIYNFVRNNVIKLNLCVACCCLIFVYVYSVGRDGVYILCLGFQYAYIRIFIQTYILTYIYVNTFDRNRDQGSNVCCLLFV